MDAVSALSGNPSRPPQSDGQLPNSEGEMSGEEVKFQEPRAKFQEPKRKSWFLVFGIWFLESGPLTMASCKYHPDRPGVGVCMRCRAVICNDCCTRLDGVNHCHACLKALGRPADSPSHYRVSENI